MKVDDEVLNVLSNAITDGNNLVLTGQLDRKLYERTNKVLEAAGGKWNKKAKSHVFDGDAAEAMDQIILTGEVTIPQDFGYFPTPQPVVNRLLELAAIEPGMAVLEPSAGQGAIAKSIADVQAIPHCYELQEKNVDVLQKTFVCVKKADFLSIIPDGRKYDRVVMNPPFARQDDIKHVLHAYKFLKDGGLLVSVMSAGVKFRDNKITRDFRDFVLSKGGSIEDIPEGAFKESGTMVRTIIVKIPA